MKKRYLLKFPSKATNEKVIFNLVKKYDIQINILKAQINSGEEGILLAEFESGSANFNQAKVYLEDLEIDIQTITRQIHFNEEECIHCGACTSVCFAGSLKLDDKKELEVDFEKCIGCELCVKACPLGLFSFN